MRNLTTAFATETARVYGARPVFFFAGDFGTAGVFRAWTGSTPRAWAGPSPWGGTFAANGWLLDVEPLEEVTDDSSPGLKVSLAITGADALHDLIADVKAAEIHGRYAIVALGYLADDGSLVADPAIWVYSEISQLTLDEDGHGGASVTVVLEPPLEDIDRTNRNRITAAAQLDVDPADTGLRHLANLPAHNVKWGPRYMNSLKSAK